MKLKNHLIVFGLISAFILSINNLKAQGLTQTIRGRVIDLITEMPLVGASVVLQNSDPQVGTVTDINGEFLLDDVPIGRQGIMVNYMGYHPVVLGNLLIQSGKEFVVEVKMEERIIETEEIIVSAYARKDKPINEMAMISARSFTVEETNRFAGSMGDPSRMVSSYAGVNAAGDQRNDIIIRGNSPMGLLWRVDGITVPNPNHFGALGTTGGPVSILNNNLLSNSDFFTGAFPAEYGNALAGAFDIRMRSGNNTKREYTGQVGFSGFEFGMEGPFSKNSKASYMVSYRYSTLAAFELMGMDMNIGGVPQYQDLTFKIDIPGKNYNKFSIFGIGGLSYIELLESEKDDPEIFQDVIFGSDMGVIGMSHTFYLNSDIQKAASVKTTLSIQGSRSTTELDTFNVATIDSPFQSYGNKMCEVIYGFSSQLRKKINSKNNITTGIQYDLYKQNYSDSAYNGYRYLKVTDTEGDAALSQAFFQWQHKFNDQLTLYTGLHAQHFNLNNEVSIEPRASIKWAFTPGQSMTLGYGLHSQIQPRFIYFLESNTEHISNGDTTYTFFRTNEDLGFSKSNHFVLGYDWLIGKNMRFKAEAYYQYLYNLPIEQNPSYFSMVNSGDNYYVDNRDSLVNEGTGYNMGVEFTLEKFFTDNYYFLITASFYDSQYKASDGKTRPTAFSGNYVANALGGYEFKVGKNKQNRISIDFKGVMAGGKRYLYIKEAESIAQGKAVYDEENAYDDRYSHYFRLDTRISFKMNGKRFNQEWGLDLQNITMRENVLMEAFEPATNEVVRQPQMGFMPMMLWRINF